MSRKDGAQKGHALTHIEKPPQMDGLPLQFSPQSPTAFGGYHIKKRAVVPASVLFPSGVIHGGSWPFPVDGFLFFTCLFQGYANMLDKDQKEALQVTKELTSKLIEVRSVSQGNIAEVFPTIFNVVYTTILTVSKPETSKKD